MERVNQVYRRTPFQTSLAPIPKRNRTYEKGCLFRVNEPVLARATRTRFRRREETITKHEVVGVEDLFDS